MAPYTLRLDPWAAEYEAAIQVREEEEPEGAVDLAVEGRPWAPIRPAPAPPAAPIAFVDGVRRIEQRLLVEAGQQTFFGLLGSFGVGATVVNDAAHVMHEAIHHVACIGGGFKIDTFEVALPDRRPGPAFEPESVPENTPGAPLQGLQSAMRRREAALAERLVEDGLQVFLDGPLSFLATTRGPVIGYVKRLLRAYVPPPQSGILRALAVGERTPIFAIRDVRQPRYSWYGRIGAGRPIDSALTGVVRLEASGQLELAEVQRLADQAGSILPRFASDSARDPRAPANLVPVGALETELRRRLGDHEVIRRAIESRLHEEVFS